MSETKKISFFNISDETDKIDNAATDGLAGVSNSLAYRTHEIEKHFHSYEKGFGLAAVPSGETHRADRLGVGINPFQIDAGNNDWGSWVQVIGSSDTPAVSGNAYFDFHTVTIVAAERTATYFIQFAAGASGAAALSAETFTEKIFKPQSVQGKPADILVQMPRVIATTKIWVRCLCFGQNTATLDFYETLHEYEG
jgi:hypothetical protein